MMTDEQRRSHAMQQLRAARELYSDTGDRAYLAVIDVHLRTIEEVDTRRRIAEARRAALLELRRQSGDGPDEDAASSSNLIEQTDQTDSEKSGPGAGLTTLPPLDQG